MMKMLPLIALCFGLLSLTWIKKATVIQIEVSAILNARPVTVLSHGKLVTWTTGIDGNGRGDGYLTNAAAILNGDTMPHALPDNPVFTANAFHPEIVLHYSNKNTTKNQTLNISREGGFTLTVPKHMYTGMYLCLTSSEGPSQLQFQLIYIDGTATQNFKLPDYYDDLPTNDPNIGYLAHDLAKWDDKNHMRETNHHNIDVVNIHPDASRILTAIKVVKAKAGYMVFWGATGIALN